MGKLENPVVRDCIDYLTLQGWFAWKVSNMGVKRERGFSFSGTKGVPDITAISRTGRVIFVECKAPGKLYNQSHDQKTFENRILKHNGTYILTDGIDLLAEKLNG